MKNYNFTDLVVLVGHNPLPAYVVGEWFIKNNSNLKNIWLVHTGKDGTKNQAINLKDTLDSFIEKNNKEINTDYWEIRNESIPKKISEDIQNKLKSVKSNSIHLDYTGATKAISVHTHKVFRDNLRDKKLTFSYLDASKFKIADDEEDCYITGDLRKEIHLDLESILGLHGFQGTINKNNPKSKGWIEIKTEKAFLSNDAIDFIVEKIKNGNIKELLDKDKPIKDEKSKGEDKNKCEKTKPVKNDFLINEIKNKCHKDEDHRFYDGGIWLEQYIARTIFRNIDRNIKIYCDINAKPKASSKKYFFQLDIVLIYGYQIIGISCGVTSDKAKAKTKGFEVSSRARQLGGDEARSILICGLDELGDDNGEEINVRQAVQDELSFETGGGIGNFTVLGREQINEESIIKTIRELIK